MSLHQTIASLFHCLILSHFCRLWHISRSECLCCFQHIDFVTAICFHPRVRLQLGWWSTYFSFAQRAQSAHNWFPFLVVIVHSDCFSKNWDACLFLPFICLKIDCLSMACQVKVILSNVDKAHVRNQRTVTVSNTPRIKLLM